MANEVTAAFAAAWPDGPTSSPAQPLKSAARAIGPVIDAQIAGAAAGLVRAATLAGLPAGTRVGQPGEVTNDGANTGSYSWSGTAWVRIGDLIDPTAIQSDIDGINATLDPLQTTYGEGVGALVVGLVPTRAGYAEATTDENGRIIRAHRLRDDMEVLGASGVETAYVSRQDRSSGKYRRSKSSGAVLSKMARVIAGEATDGIYLNSRKLATADDIAANYVVGLKVVSGEQHVFSERRDTGKRLQLSKAGTSNSSPRIERDGSVSWDQIATGYSSVRMWSPVDVAVPHAVMPRAEISLWGDSLVEQDYGTQLATLAGIPVHNFGKSGSTSRAVAVRMGARPMRLVSLSGQIPASGSVSVSSVDGLGAASYFANVDHDSPTGSLGGVPGKLTWTQSTQRLTFTRTTSGSAVTLAPGAPFIPDLIDSLTSAVVTAPTECISVFQFGRNNTNEPDRIVADFQACVAALPTRVKRFIIIPYFPTKTEVQGIQQPYTNWIYLMKRVKALWPDNTIDMLAALIANATSSTDDQAAVAGGYAPPSLMQVDEIHPGPTGKTVEAQTIDNFMIAKGWL